MGDVRLQSPAQKRRAGLPSSTTHGGVAPVTEDSMAVGLSGMAQVGNPRTPMDMGAIQALVNRSAAGSPRGITRPRYSQDITDPGLFPHAEPKPVMVTGKSGARYGIKVNYAALYPDNAKTQANGRVIRGRGTGASFWSGSAS